MAGKEIAVKKYVVKLSPEERERLEALVPYTHPEWGDFTASAESRVRP